MPTTTSRRQRVPAHRSSLAVAIGTIVATLVSLVGIDATIAGAQVPSDPTGFDQPFAGAPDYLPLAPTQLVDPADIHAPIGRALADEIAAALGLDAADAFTPEQYLEFISGRGVGGDPSQARLVDASALILTNTVGRPLPSVIDGRPVGSVLASYGLYVDEGGLLMSPANAAAPTRQVNAVIAPGGYMGTWCRDNGCEASVEALYASGYTDELVFGLFSQQISGAAQLVPNTKGGTTTQVGMPLAPSIWLINFALLYVLNPDVAANMPAAWAPIPSNVADAILASPSGQVPYCEYAEDLGAEPVPCPAPPTTTSTTSSVATPTTATDAVVVAPTFTG